MKFKIWGLTGTLATQRAEQMPLAEQRLWHWIDAFDAAMKARDEYRKSKAAAPKK